MLQEDHWFGLSLKRWLFLSDLPRPLLAFCKLQLHFSLQGEPEALDSFLRWTAPPVDVRVKRDSFIKYFKKQKSTYCGFNPLKQAITR